jgi:hypothetical protein
MGNRSKTEIVSNTNENSKYTITVFYIRTLILASLLVLTQIEQTFKIIEYYLNLILIEKIWLLQNKKKRNILIKNIQIEYSIISIKD